MSSKSETFKFELGLIADKYVREFTMLMIEEIPDYFFEIPASSTGKYHPNYALGDGGLVRHVKAAVRIAVALFRNDTVTGKFSPLQKDYILAALLLHDGVKSGIVKSKYTVERHAVLMTEFMQQKIALFPIESLVVFDNVKPLIASHMGQWNTDRDGAVHSPLPITASERFVHMCDYLASRKFIEINFDAAL